MRELLIVDDDDGIRASLTLALEDEGYRVHEACSADEAMTLLAGRRGMDLLLVDLMLGGLDGFSLIARVRPTCDAPVIVISARQDASDVVAALEAGADDYVTKPFDVPVLLARVKALLRRGRAATSLAPPAASAAPADPPPASGPSAAGRRRTVLDAGAGPLVLDVDAGTLRRGADQVHLTVTEFRLLCELSASAGRLLSRTELLERVWDRDWFGDERIVDVHVRRLRLKVEEDPSDPRLITTVRGLGYRLDVA